MTQDKLLIPQGTAKLSLNGKEIELPLVAGTEQELAVDISNLRAKTGYITLDPAFMTTASCTSSITFIDGEKGILRYRGIPIEEIAEKSSFLETSYLLIYGQLPTQEQLDGFRSSIKQHSQLPEEQRALFNGFPKGAHPMAILSSVVCALSTFYQDSLNPKDPAQVELSIFRLMAKMPLLAACAHRKSAGLPFNEPDSSLKYTENFLKMMFSSPSQPYEVDPEIAKILNLLLVLHADHEQNCSTSTVRLVGSSGTNLYASVSAGICALWGKLHGGANQEVIEMLQHILADGGDVKKYINLAKQKDSGFRLMGFGHRVYKNFDPRATIIKKACDRVLEKTTGKKTPLFEIAQELEQTALKDSYFIDRKLYPNVDFYSGIIYRALGIPVNMLTVIFAMGRLPGWISQWMEMHKTADGKIGRPRQIYTGAKLSSYVPIEQRGK